jgi:hypothetical protein
LSLERVNKKVLGICLRSLEHPTLVWLSTLSFLKSYAVCFKNLVNNGGTFSLKTLISLLKPGKLSSS